MVSALSSDVGGAQQATLNSPIFQLPMELREMIYVHLFKRGRLHVWYFGSKDSKVFREGWWHTVCHRLADYGTDRCRTRPIAAQKNFLTHEQIEIARLQVFGWLLSCSRAYHESIHFLYSANTFSIEPNYFPPFSDVKRLFPSHCLSAVRSLELLYPVATYRDLPVLDRFTSTIAHIPLIFPHLRSFHIAISSWWMLCALEHWENFAADHSELVKSELLGTLDGLVSEGARRRQDWPSRGFDVQLVKENADEKTLEAVRWRDGLYEIKIGLLDCHGMLKAWILRGIVDRT
ncbi:hypothetical protein LOZ12_001366 [Ophidiomyces ophidiicola]|nr:hypothetical protein LOZ64_004219 [Ophidiomyces ophidiicola]KAI1924869.1 hypothetical protein LOZ60_004469 [Ophidiomyces ophidiicola]KAI1966160.1 hypothetical protein LOZ59_000977 [Ophidiomyces ophidiicola]KAI1976279.1 hypothetical protein LOZ56_000014 [Ophidiomyces ophidiicola]KAI2037513.1 hypothetical protein LOZ47_003674 [Ophidiomyces ophidiicola]